MPRGCFCYITDRDLQMKPRFALHNRWSEWSVRDVTAAGSFKKVDYINAVPIAGTLPAVLALPRLLVNGISL